MQDARHIVDQDVSGIQHALKLFVVEFSLSEKGTFIRTLEKVLADNISNVRGNIPKDYLPVGVFDSRDEAEKFRDRLLLIVTDENRVESRWQRLADILEKSLEQRTDKNLPEE